VQLNPALSRAQANLSLDQYNPQRYEELMAGRAERRSPRAVEVAEGGQLAHYNLGLAFRQKGYYAEAQREYRLALHRGEDPALVLQALAEVHLLRKDPAAAIELYDQLLADGSDSPKLWNERGVALHHQGLHAEAAASYRRALAADGRYALAHNNLGVALFHGGEPEAAVDAFRAALHANAEFVKVRLNLALLLQKSRRFPMAMEAYRQVLVNEPENPLAWNGIGLVLGQLRRFEEARGAFARAIQARPDFAEAHYNLSFMLSNLGDFEGALRETKRALELDSYYVPQKFALAIDFEYEDPDLSVEPDLGGERAMNTGVDAFAFDPGLLDSLFSELSPHPGPEPEEKAGADPYAMAADYLSTGLYDRAAAETSRALLRGADHADGQTLLGDILCRQGAHGDALERYRAARTTAPAHLRARRGEAQMLLALGRAAEARALAETLSADEPDDVDALLLVSSCRFESGDPDAALEALDAARNRMPARADVLLRMGHIRRSLGDVTGASEAYRQALELDGDFAAVRFDLARLLMEQRLWDEAEQQLQSALETVPTYADATLALSALRRLTGRAEGAVSLLVDLLLRDPYHFDALIALGETMLELGRKADAATAFRRVLTFDPDHVAAIFYDGVMLADQRRYRDALTQWARVVELDPDGAYAERARRESRTATDLLKVFGDRPRRP
jgi:tetratricopeptide (TPR) repeat protein